MEYTGVKILRNSFSSHIKDEFRALVSYGIPTEEAEELILAHYRDFQDGCYRGPFWLGLARAETDTGRLSQRVKEEALAVMADGSDLELWDMALLLEAEDRKANRRNGMEYAQVIETLLLDWKREYEQTTDEVRRATIRSEQVYFSAALEKIREQLASKVGEGELPLPPQPDDGWEPPSLQKLSQEERALLKTYQFGIADDSQFPRLPERVIRSRLLGEILWLDGSMEKKRLRRIREHEALRADMDRPQVPKKISKPYATPSPWEEGDVFWMQLKELTGELEPWNGCYVAYRVIAVRRYSFVSRVRPDLGHSDDIALGLYRWVGKDPPTMEELERAGYVSWGSFMTVEQKGLWLSLYGELRTVKKWSWEVIGKSPNFSRILPPFFKDGAIYSRMASFGRRLAQETARILAGQGLAPMELEETT